MRDFSKKYLEYLTGPLAGINLTRITNEDEFYHKQILDSVVPLDYCPIFTKLLAERGILVDIGFGGGFPILPLAFRVPRGTFIGFEARGKKASAVSQVAGHLGIGNARLYHQRVEEVEFDLPCVVTFKAVGKISDMLQLIHPSAPTVVYFYKGPNWQELEDLGPIEPRWKLIEQVDIEIPDTEGRTILGFEWKKVPCGTKNLVKLSKFL